MAGKYTWKLIVTTVVMVWAVLNLVPFTDTDFEDYVRQEAVGGPEFEDLMTKADALVAKDVEEGGKNKTFYLALKAVAEQEQVDLASKFFPQVRMDTSLVNLRKRNTILLDELLRRSRGALQLGLDLRGGVAFTLEVDRPPGTELAAGEHEAELSKAIEIIADRVDALGVAEPIIRPLGENRIVVQLAGLSTKDNPEVVEELKKPALLEFRQVHYFLNPETTPLDQVPPDYEEMVLEEERQGRPIAERLFVRRAPDLTGEMVERAGVARNEFGNPYVILDLTDIGGRRFADLTTEIVREVGPKNGRIAIILDGKLQSAPTVEEPITGGSASIRGQYSELEAFHLANVLNNPLDVPLRVVQVSEIRATMAEDAVSSGQKAFIIGTALTALFIAVYYTSAGLLAVVAMVLNVVLILGVMCSEFVGATLSMPGIAGIILTLGMSVDSNILIFERMREEVAVGKNLRASLEAGFEKAFSAILDANVTTLITAALMWRFGTGPVRGFGITLTIGIFSTMFAALIISRLLLELVIYTDVLKRVKFLSFVPETKIDFMKYARPAFLGSWTIVLIGVVAVFWKGDAIFGKDFLGGDEITLNYTQRLDLAQIREAGIQAGAREVTPAYETLLGTDTEVLKIQTQFDEGDRVVAKLQELHPDAGIDKAGESRIGPSVSDEIKRNAFLAISLSLVGILLYVAFRFEMGYGVGAVVSTIHDIVMTIGIFVLLGRQFNAAMVGAILLIAGYSINDTIVVFDRIREELKLNPNARLRDVINLSLNKTLARTIITGGTTFATAITLAVVASGEVNDIAVTLIIGIITGTFSSLFIASPIFFWWHKGDRKHVEASHDIAPKYEWSASSRAAE